MALMVVMPAATPVAWPDALTVAMVVIDEAHVAIEVMSRVIPSLNIPVAVKFVVPPTATFELPVTWMAVSVPIPPTVITDVAVRAVMPERASDAVMVAIPLATPVTRPALLTVAIIALLLDHVRPIVTGAIMVPVVPVTISCCVPPGIAIVAVAGVIAIRSGTAGP